MQPMSLASFCSAQLPLRTHMAQRQSCWERIRRTFVLRVSRTRGELVCSTIPSSTVLLQEVIRCSLPSTSTRQTRQAAISLMPRR